MRTFPPTHEKEQNFDKVFGWIKSCTNEWQLQTVEVSVHLYIKQHEDFVNLEKLLGMVEYKRKEINAPKLNNDNLSDGVRNSLIIENLLS